MRPLVRNSGLSHGSKLFYVTTATLVSDSVSRGLGRAQHSARESALIAGLGAGPGSNNPPLSASLPTLPIVLQETGGGNVTAAVSALGQCMNQGPSFLTSLLNPSPQPGGRGSGYVTGFCLSAASSLPFKEFSIQAICFQVQRFLKWRLTKASKH